MVTIADLTEFNRKAGGSGALQGRGAAESHQRYMADLVRDKVGDELIIAYVRIGISICAAQWFTASNHRTGLFVIYYKLIEDPINRCLKVPIWELYAYLDQCRYTYGTDSAYDPDPVIERVLEANYSTTVGSERQAGAKRSVDADMNTLPGILQTIGSFDSQRNVTSPADLARNREKDRKLAYRAWRDKVRTFAKIRSGRLTENFT